MDLGLRQVPRGRASVAQGAEIWIASGVEMWDLALP